MEGVTAGCRAVALGAITAGALALAGCERVPDEEQMADAASGLAPAEPGVSSVRPAPAGIDLTLSASPARSAGRTACHGIVGTLHDKDPAGRIIRDGPSLGARELGRIPASPVITDEYGAEWEYSFDIVGSQDGWLEIENAGYDTYAGGPAPQPNYKGRGWIAAGGVRVTVQATIGFEKPDHSSAVLIDARPDEGVLEEFGPKRVIACEGRWILGDFAPQWDSGASTERRLAYRKEAVASKQPLMLRAWTAGICNNLETTCDGVDGDFAETSQLERED